MKKKIGFITVVFMLMLTINLVSLAYPDDAKRKITLTSWIGYGNAQGFTTCDGAIDVISLEARVYNNGNIKDTDIDRRTNTYVVNDASAPLIL